MSTKSERLEHANQLIRVIADHGRRFFFYAGSNVYNPHTKTTAFVPANRYAYLEIRWGRVYFIDDYSERAVYTHHPTFGNRWRGFSRGGTLRDLVEDMRDYVMNGKQIARWKIAPERIRVTDGNIWGYSTEEAEKVRALAYALPIIEPAKNGD